MDTASLHLCRIGADFHRRGWVLATSGNFSALASRDPYRLLITASGRHKGMLGEGDFLLLDQRGQTVEPGPDKPSAEAALHLLLTQQLGAGAVLHTHSVWGTILSEHFGPQGGFDLAGFEMLKAFPTVKTHEFRLRVPIFDNTQDISALAERVAPHLTRPDQPVFGFLIRRHGLYTWGKDLTEAHRHIEAFEFLFEIVGRELSIAKG
jgi:methylthioribulose-1-phosphate dehydratase